MNESSAARRGPISVARIASCKTRRENHRRLQLKSWCTDHIQQWAFESISSMNSARVVWNVEIATHKSNEYVHTNYFYGHKSLNEKNPLIAIAWVRAQAHDIQVFARSSSPLRAVALKRSPSLGSPSLSLGRLDRSPCRPPCCPPCRPHVIRSADTTPSSHSPHFFNFFCAQLAHARAPRHQQLSPICIHESLKSAVCDYATSVYAVAPLPLTPYRYYVLSSFTCAHTYGARSSRRFRAAHKRCEIIHAIWMERNKSHKLNERQTCAAISTIDRKWAVIECDWGVSWCASYICSCICVTQRVFSCWYMYVPLIRAAAKNIALAIWCCAMGEEKSGHEKKRANNGDNGSR